jgi:ParB family chromosome partitioning protein
MTESKRGDIQEIEVKLIDEVGEENVRTRQQDIDIENLKASINKLGLLQPITVFEKNGRYRLVIGQRRFLAVKELGWKTITANVISPVDLATAKLLSLSENLQRRKLSYKDIVKACDSLYEKFKAVKNVANEIGISPQTVIGYLKHRFVPEEVREMVDEGKLTRERALAITSAFYQDKGSIIQMAKNVSKMTRVEWYRAISYRKSHPNAPVEEVIEASKRSKTKEVILAIDEAYWKALGYAAKERETDLTELVGEIIAEWLKGEGYA